MAKLYTKSI